MFDGDVFCASKGADIISIKKYKNPRIDITKARGFLCAIEMPLKPKQLQALWAHLLGRKHPQWEAFVRLRICGLNREA